MIVFSRITQTMVFHLSFHYLSFCSSSGICLIVVQDIPFYLRRNNFYSSFPVITVGNVGILYCNQAINSLFVSHQNSPITSIDTEFILSSWKEFADYLLLIGSKEIMWIFCFVKRKMISTKRYLKWGWNWDLLWSTMMPSWLS